MIISVTCETLHTVFNELTVKLKKKIPVDDQYLMLITVAVSWICAFKAN